MCRLYGFRATDPTRIECSLVEAQNALLKQSDRDGRGVANPDGWGIATWDANGLKVERRARSAADDLVFTQVAARARPTTAIAHVRAATVGGPAPGNTHPFHFGPWAFAHNGTLTAFDRIAPLLDTGPFPPLGTTDSEHIFMWMLRRMPEFGLDPRRPADSPKPIENLLTAAITDLDDMAATVGAHTPPKLNFLISDGTNLVASRWGNTLYRTFRDSVTDCEVCGLPHCDEVADRYRAVAIASEPITSEEWTEVPDGSIVSVDGSVSVTTGELLARAA